MTGVSGKEHVYLVSTRLLDGVRSFGAMERNVFLRGVLKGAEFCGIEVLTFCLAEREIRLLVRVPHKRAADATVDDLELKRRLTVLYGEEETAERWDILETKNKLGERGRYLARMHDLGLFMKEVKLRYSKWVNRRAKRVGTAWCERYQSTLIDSQDRAAMLEAAREVEQFAVREGLAKSPRMWPWCGACLAARGTHPEAVAGICTLLGASIEQSMEAVRSYVEWVCDEVRSMPSASPKRSRGAEWEGDFDCVVPLSMQAPNLIAGAIVYGAGAFVDAMAERSARKKRESGIEGRALLQRARERPRRK